jgi:putative chitinase
MNLENVKLIKDTALRAGLLRNQLAYVLATAQWETNHTFEPVKEAYFIKAKDKEAWRKKNLRYYPWYGRGFVQLTWEYNYKKAGEKIGVNLLANPDLAMEPRNAAEILVEGMKEGWFTGKKLSDYITLKASDFVNARRIINGTDKAKEIAAIARDWDAKLKAEGYGVTLPPADPIILPEEAIAVEEYEAPINGDAPKASWFTDIIISILAFFGIKKGA